MAVYVNKLRDRSRLLFGRTSPPPPLFGLTADTEDELHAFAARLGIRRDPGTPVGPQQELVTRHYLLTEGQREEEKLEGQRAAMREKARDGPYPGHLITAGTVL